MKTIPWIDIIMILIFALILSACGTVQTHSGATVSQRAVHPVIGK
jgi:uncharacterized protein YceK